MIESLIEEVKSRATIYTSYSNREAFQALPMELCKYRPSWWELFLDPIRDYSIADMYIDDMRSCSEEMDNG